MIILLLAQLWFSIPAGPDEFLVGTWQVCGDQERSYSQYREGKLLWTIHLGPNSEFALYEGAGLIGPHNHVTPDNLLYPDHIVVDDFTTRGKVVKHIYELGITVSISQAGETRACESFYIKVSKLDQTKSR